MVGDPDDSEIVHPVASTRRIVVGVGCAIGLAASIAGTVFSLSTSKHAEPTQAVAVAVEAVSAPAPSVDEPVPAPPPTTTVEKTGFARLVIKGQASHHRVYFDGKLLLGQGTRTFTVRCGDHTIAIDDKASPRDVDLPCNGELALTR